MDMNYDLKAEMAKLPEPVDKPWPDWDHWRYLLWHDAQKEPPETFTTWRITRHTMLGVGCRVDVAWEQVKDNLKRYSPAMASPAADLLQYEGYDRNMVRLVGRVAFWEKNTGRRVEELGRVLEVGAGFGALRLAFHHLGFHGEYGILDLPEMIIFQTWFLSRFCIPFTPWRPGPCDLLVAYCSLSEMPIDEREKAYKEAKPKSCLFEYSPSYHGRDNIAWFAEKRTEWKGQAMAIINKDMPIEAWW